jgi:DNA-directed RNA polymerase subunit F
MGDDAVTQLTYQLLVDAQQAIANFKAAADSADQYNAAIQRIELTSDTSAGAATKVKVILKDTGDAAKAAAPGVDSFTQGLAGLATAVVGALSIQKVIAFLSEAGETALEYSQALFKMDVAVRALQRSGMDTTLQDWTSEVAALSDQFHIFSNIEITNALGQSALMGREFNLTKDQMVQLTKIAMVFSEVTGRDLTGAIQAVTYFIDTGYTKSIRGLGVAISQGILQAAAQAAGYKTAYKDLDALTQAQIRFQVLTSQTNTLIADAGTIMDTWSGKMQTADAAATNAMTNLGQAVEPWMVGIKNAWAGFVQRLADGIAAGEKYIAIWGGMFAALVAEVVYDLKVIGDALNGHFISWKDYWDGLANAMTVGFKSGVYELSKAMGLFDQGMTDAEKAAKLAADDAAAAQEKFETDLSKFESDLAKIQTDANNKRLDAQLDYTRKLDDLALNYTRDVTDINTDFDRREAEARTQAHNKTLADEEMFQEKLLELREKYLYNLDDAVRLRDARKVLDLNRQYNMDRADAERQQAIKRHDAEEQLKYDLAVMEIERRQRLADRALRLKQDQDDAKLALARKIQDIQTEETARLQALLKGFEDEQQLTQEGAQAVYDILNKYYGPGGAVEGLYNYLIGMMTQARNAAALMAKYSGPGAESGGYYGTPSPYGNRSGAEGYAEGGSVIASRPTAAIFGEAGPELATFTPLSRAGANVGKLTGNVPSGSGGKATISINLGAGLVGQIVDNAMGEVATVLLNSEG